MRWHEPRLSRLRTSSNSQPKHPLVRGLRRIERVLDLVEAGAESPKESWLRTILIEGGYPRPRTQIPVLDPDGYPRYRLDMGWPDLMIAVEYDGDQHRLDPVRYRQDIVRAEYIEQVGWRRLRVIAGDRAPEILRRVSRVWPR
jgi:very-short-patch-repair endonuclease